MYSVNVNASTSGGAVMLACKTVNVAQSQESGMTTETPKSGHEQ